MALGADAGGDVPARAHGPVGEMLVAAAIFAVVMAVTWMTHGPDGPGAGVFVAGSGSDGGGDPSGTAPGERGDVVSYGPDGEIVRQAPDTTRVVDPETGDDVVVTLPSSTTTVPGAAPGTASTVPVTTAPAQSSTTTPTTAGPTTTEPPTTTTTTEPPTTTTTEPPTTTTSTPANPEG